MNWRFSKLLGWVVLFLLFLPQATAQTPPPLPPNNGTTSDYLPEGIQLLFPSAAASLDLSEIQNPFFPTSTNGFDMLSLGAATDARATGPILKPLTKNLTLQLKGGVRGRIFASPPWLQPLPDRFINPKDSGELKVAIQARQDAAQGAGLLPAQTNWGRLRLALNGAIFDYAVQVIVGPPPAPEANDAIKVFGLYRQIVAKLDSQGDLKAAITTPEQPNAAQFILGLVVDYLGENRYNNRLTETDFAGRVAETLAGKDYNADNWIGFRQEDILLGAPGWLLGKQVK